ncbi:DUF899 family protein [Luteimonas vadosa]|uniref:DUF899 domain-containing protein n=1 Tax=Luteimonas vadosa TaxID=1165507 RepID=A0ABP9DWK7_9GAMM
MSVPRYPNESEDYRRARNALLDAEQRLVDQVKAVAALRRRLPPGGELKEDYTFASANRDTLGEPIRFSELFGDKDTLLLYSYMFGKAWDKPCPSCTSLIDGFDRATISVRRDAAFVVVARAPAERLRAWADTRGWNDIDLVSAESNTYLADYKCQDGDGDDGLQPIMHVFTRSDGMIRHFWGTELRQNHVDTVWPYWNLMDMTPEGRPDVPTPPQDFRSRFLEQHYLDGDG